ncbi:5-(carboxyamino)imidazole ribonucleotide synthase [Halovenus marina]|uniref:5-(carboxyamino)imidazole ribonucleotide synthase n=1 Tax=Halovenus marina TaxID=3396621 RepID=UPI003F54A7DC
MTLTSGETVVGVVGGGQLGRMLGEAAGPLGIDLVVSDPTQNAPAASVVSDQIVGAFDDESTIRALAERSSYLTYEIELADPDALERISEETDTPVHPHPETLRLIEDKLRQKRRLSEAGIPVPAFRQVDSAEQLRDALDELGYPAMLKAREGGYDGRGNVPVHSPEDVEDAVAAIDGPAMVEEFVDYERELAVMGAVGDGEVDTFPVTETIHEEEILRETASPARTTPEVRARAKEVVRDVLDVLSGRGVFGVELFETSEGEILLNEIAPRPHNSGHWTIEGCHTSQFEQHLRGVTGRPLGTTERRAPTVSTNILGDVEKRQRATLTGETAVFERPRAHLHWYGKREVYRLRKMGHVTLVGDDAAEDDDAESAEDILADVRTLRDGLTFTE